MLKTARLIWGGLLLSPILLGFIAWVLLASQKNRSEAVSLTNPLLLVFLLVAAVVFVVASKLQAIQSSRLEYASEDVSNQQRLARYIVQLALFEVPAILGFSLAVLNGSLLVFAPFLLLSLIGFAISYPGKGK